MGEKLVECVPNISEGRDRRVIEGIVDAVAAVAGVKVLHVDCGYDANRSVITFIGQPQAVLCGARKLVEEALERIDLSKHRGTHPRIGAVDVCPFIPYQNVDSEACIQLSKLLASHCANELGLPVFLYAQAAESKVTRYLWQLRRGGLPELARRLSSRELTPAFGPASLHPTFGALVTGARRMLIAFNVTLDGLELETAQQIASNVREKTYGRCAKELPVSLNDWTGLKGVQAIGWDIPKYHASQVSMNLLKPEVCSMHLAYCAVSKWAEYFGTSVRAGELIGLAQRKYFNEAGDFFAAKRNIAVAQDGILAFSAESLRLSQTKEDEIELRTIEGSIRRNKTLWTWK